MKHNQVSTYFLLDFEKKMCKTRNNNFSVVKCFMFVSKKNVKNIKKKHKTFKFIMSLIFSPK